MLTKKDFRSSIELKWRVHQIELSVFPVLFILIIFILIVFIPKCINYNIKFIINCQGK